MARLTNAQKTIILNLVVYKSLYTVYKEINNETDIQLNTVIRYFNLKDFPNLLSNIYSEHHRYCSVKKMFPSKTSSSEQEGLKMYSKIGFYKRLRDKDKEGIPDNIIFLFHFYYSILYTSLVIYYITTLDIKNKPEIKKLIKLSDEELYTKAKELFVEEHKETVSLYLNTFKIILERNNTFTDFLEEGRYYGK